MASIVAETRRRAKDYWEIDGLPRIVSGLFSVLFGTLLLWLSLSGPLSLLLGGIGIVVLFLFDEQDGQKDIVEWFKTRITYPRTGYVDSLEETRPFRTGVLDVQAPPAEAPKQKQPAIRRLLHTLAAVTLVGTWIAAWMSVFFFPKPWICVVAGFLAAIFSLFGNSPRKDRLVWLSFAGWILIGISLAKWSFARRETIPFLILAAGIVSLLRGTLTLFLYIRRYPLPRSVNEING